MKDLRVLIADDFSLVRSLIVKSLSKLEVTQIDEASDGEEAIRKIEEAKARGQAYDVVFIDWNMPVKNGLEVVTYCKQHPELKQIPFIMISAERDKVRVVQALKAGVFDYIVKPFEPSMLVLKLQRACAQKAN